MALVMKSRLVRYQEGVHALVDLATGVGQHRIPAVKLRRPICGVVAELRRLDIPPNGVFVLLDQELARAGLQGDGAADRERSRIVTTAVEWVIREYGS